MAAYRIVSDSTADLTPERMQELGVPFIPLHVLIEGEDVTDDMHPETALAIYRAMREGKTGTTSQVSIDAFIEFWEPYLAAGEDLLYIGFSSGLSGTFNSARLAREQLLGKYPERSLYVVDSLCASSGEGLFLEQVAALRDSGLTLTELYEKAEELKLRVHHWFTVDDLVYLRRGGRVSGAAALFATLLSIKPILNMNNEGKLIPREKVKGRSAAIKRLVELMQEKMDVKATPFVNICQADCMEDAEHLTQLIHERFPALSVRIYSTGAVIGSHSGPGTLSVFFMGEPRTV